MTQARVNVQGTVRSRALASLGCVALLVALSTQEPVVVRADTGLTITAPGTLTLPALVMGRSTAATALGSLSWTDTLNTGTAWSVTLAATNLWHAAGAGLYIPWARFTITVDPTPVPDSMDTGDPVVVPPGSPYVLAGAAATDFSTFSTPITLATGSATSQGTWTTANNRIVVAVPANTTPSTSFVGTIQYTLTG